MVWYILDIGNFMQGGINSFLFTLYGNVCFFTMISRSPPPALDLEFWFNKVWSMLHSYVHLSSCGPSSWDSFRGTWSEGGCIWRYSVSLPENLLTIDFIWRSPWFLGTGVSWNGGQGGGYVGNIKGTPSPVHLALMMEPSSAALGSKPLWLGAADKLDSSVLSEC